MRIGLLLIRLMLGITFTIHGAQKVFGGFKEPMAMISDLGFPAFFGVILGLFEFIGGILMIIGLFANYIGVCRLYHNYAWSFIYCSSVTRLYDI